MTAYSDKVANIDTNAVSTSVTAAMNLKTLISNLTNLDTSGIENFKVLIVLWKKFYNFRPKDATSLYHSTTIPFNILQEVATLLLMKDPNSKMSLYYEGKND